MAAKKADTKPVEAKKEEKAKVDTTAAKSEAPVVDTKPVEAVKPVKVYAFTSENAYLTVSSLGVQFIDGKATTTDLAVARALATIEGVKLVEE